MKTKLTEQSYWVDVQGNINLDLADDNIIKLWIEKNLDLSNINSCIEIGCFPGRYLTIFGNNRIELNGLDFIQEVKFLKQKFQENGFVAGSFINADFTTYVPEKKYDCVASFGFVEHFVNWEVIFKNHFNYVSNNGYLIIEAPNFKGFFQRLPRFLFDYKNYKRHNVKAMDLEKWKKILVENKFEIINAEYFGGYQLWNENDSKNRYFLKIKFFTEKLLFKLKDTLCPNSIDNKSFSCYLGIIAKKTNNNEY